MYCKKCAAYVPENAKFCANCGLQDPTPYWQKNDTVRPQPQSPFREQPKPNYQQQPIYKQQPSYQQRPQVQVKTQAQKLTELVKNKKKPIMAIVAVMAIVLIVAVITNGSNLKGTWKSEDGSYSITFSDSTNGYIYDHGIVYSSSDRLLNFTYDTEGKILVLKTESTLFTNATVARYEFDVNGNKLTLTDTDTGDTEIFYKTDN